MHPEVTLDATGRTRRFSRRHFLQAGASIIGAVGLRSSSLGQPHPRESLRIAFLHLAPRLGDLTSNRQLLEAALSKSAELGANWVLTPELCICGYSFAERIGADWIAPQPDPWMKRWCELTARLRVTTFLSHPERDLQTGKLHNSVFVINDHGKIVGRHRKINTLRVGSESWSSPGEQATSIPLLPFHGVGVLICADAYTPWIAKSLRAQGAQLLISSAAWAPGLHGPQGEWERCTADTGAPLLVCNRTGADRTLNFHAAESVIVKDGQRLLSLSAKQSTIFMIDWDVAAQTLASTTYQCITL